MSNVTVIQTYDRLWIGADSAVSTVIDGKWYRWHENGQKLFLIDDMVIFCSGVMELSKRIMSYFSEQDDRSVESLRVVASSFYKDYITKNPDRYDPKTNICLEVLIGKIVNGRSVVYSISPHDNFEIVSRVLEDAGQFAVWSGGIRVEESRNAAYSLFSQTLNIDLTFQHTFNEISFEGIGGKLTVYQIDKDGVMELLQINILEKPNMNRIITDIVDLSYQGLKIEKLLIVAERIFGNIGSFVTMSADSIVTGALSGINMQIGSGANSFHADASGISLGGTTWASSPFRVDMAGNAWATSMTLQAPSITNGHIVGTDINIGNGKFTVDASGVFTATGANISGNISMTGGTISWGSIAAPNYSQIGGSKPPTNADNTQSALVGNGFTTIGSNYVYTGTLYTDHAVVGTGANSIGDINLSISGGYATIRTAYTTGGNSLMIGKTTTLGALPEKLERLDIYAYAAYLYGNTYFQGGVDMPSGTIANKPIATQEWVQGNTVAKFG